MALRRRRIGLIVVGLLLLLFFVTVKVVSPKSATEIAGGISDAPFGGFAGYAWIGKVDSIGASFAVPSIADGSTPGFAGTWIGAQGQGPPDRFVQIGVIEDREGSRDHYFAFWSGTDHHYQAQPLFGVSAGDALSASLTLTSGSWMLAIADATSHRSKRFSVGDLPRSPFSQAEWTQEDPGGENDHAQYPAIAPPVFSDMTVDSTVPSRTYPALYTTWMSTDHVILAPTALKDGSFTLHRAPALSAAGKQYLRLTGSAVAAFEKFEIERGEWTPATSYAEIFRASTHLEEVMRRAAQALHSARWPRKIDALLRVHQNLAYAYLARLRPPKIWNATSFATWNSRLTDASDRAAVAGNRLLAALGLPGGLSPESGDAPG